MAYEHFYLALPFILEALEIINATHTEMRSFEKKYTEGWDYKTKQEATLLINAVSSFVYRGVVLISLKLMMTYQV